MLGEWSVKFPGCEPVAHRMREAFPTRWVRFHSLGGAKRYPDNEEEYATVLGRQNRILDELIGDAASIVVLTTEYSGPPGTLEIAAGPDLGAIIPDAKPWRSVPMHELDAEFIEPTYWHVSASELTWRPGRLDALLRLVADDIITNVMILPPSCRWLFHPYDGGMDLILETPADRDRLRSSHADWLSPRSDGM